MFEAARLKLTAWYVAIILVVSILFSVAFYQASTREIQRILIRIQSDSLRPAMIYGRTSSHLPTPPSVEELQAVRQRLQLTLLFVNIAVGSLAGAAGYFLAGKTLRPIKQMIEAQNDFISNASHELRTPLATLQVEMEALLLEKRISAQNARELIVSNLEEVRSLQQLANDLLELEHMESIELHDLRPLSLNEVMSAACKRVERAAKQKNIKLRRTSTELHVVARKKDLEEVLVILLDNAVAYSSENGQVFVSARHNGSSVQIVVKDSGLGIAPEDVPHVFERFYRGVQAREKNEGFGLGLAIAQKILAAYGGILTVKSILGKGSTFTVALPVTPTTP